MSGADSGFPVGAGANPLGVPTNDFAKFSQKPWNWESFGPEGWSTGYAPLDPPLHVIIDIIIQDVDVVDFDVVDLELI